MNQNDSDKKRLTNKRTKLLAKLNRVSESEKRYEKDRAEFAKRGKVLKEVVKIYPFDAEGDAKSFRLIANAFKDLSTHP